MLKQLKRERNVDAADVAVHQHATINITAVIIINTNAVTITATIINITAATITATIIAATKMSIITIITPTLANHAVLAEVDVDVDVDVVMVADMGARREALLL